MVRIEAEKRLNERLDDSCVDQHALKTLLLEGKRKHPRLEAALEARGCRKERLVWPQVEDLDSQSALLALQRATYDSACRQAIKDLFSPNR